MFGKKIVNKNAIKHTLYPFKMDIFIPGFFGGFFQVKKLFREKFGDFPRKITDSTVYTTVFLRYLATIPAVRGSDKATKPRAQNLPKTTRIFFFANKTNETGPQSVWQAISLVASLFPTRSVSSGPMGPAGTDSRDWLGREVPGSQHKRE